MEIKLQPIEISIPKAGAQVDADSTLTSIRLTGVTAPHLIASHLGDSGFILSSSALTSGHSPMGLAIAADTQVGVAAKPALQSPPQVTALPGPPPAWDAALHQDGSISAVWTMAGSAVVQLAFRNTQEDEEAMVNEQTPFGVFGAPHFTRPDGNAHEPIASIALIDGEPQVALFKRNLDGSFDKHQVVDASWRGLPLDAKLVRWKSGFILLVKVKAPIEGELPSERQSGGGSTLSSGFIEALQLDADFQIIETLPLSIGDETLFEFDALTTENTFVIFATSKTGCRLAIRKQVKPSPDPSDLPGNSHHVETQWLPPLTMLSTAPLTSPTIVASGRQLYVAAIRNVRKPEAEIVATQINLSAF